MADTDELLPRLQSCLDSAKASEANPTSQRALEYRLAEAIAALSRRSAPAEPVAWCLDVRLADGTHALRVPFVTSRDAMERWVRVNPDFIMKPLYAAPPAAEKRVREECAQKAVAWLCEGEKPGEWKEAPHVTLDPELAGQRMQSFYWRVTPLYVAIRKGGEDA